MTETYQNISFTMWNRIVYLVFDSSLFDTIWHFYQNWNWSQNIQINKLFYASTRISVSDCIPSTISSPPSRRTSRTGEIRPPNQRTRSVTPQRLIQELSKNFQQEKMGDTPDEGKEIPIGRPLIVYDRSSGKRRLYVKIYW